MRDRVFVDGETIAVDPTTGEATIPFAKTTQHCKPVVLGMASGFATLTYITHYEESYKLTAGDTSLIHSALPLMT